jgi:predicted O-methyltransferase YrrM
MHLHEILTAEFNRFGNAPLNIIETGTIRGDSEASRLGDGWSTLWFAERRARCGGELLSIDLDVSTAATVLAEHGVADGVELEQGHSIDRLAFRCRRGRRWDVILLDSDNDAQLILHEFLIAQHLVTDGGLVMIDDVRMPNQPIGALKGDQVWPYIKKRGLAHHIVEREGWNGYRTGVLTVQL